MPKIRPTILCLAQCELGGKRKAAEKLSCIYKQAALPTQVEKSVEQVNKKRFSPKEQGG
jgi:hypothetical protein